MIDDDGTENNTKLWNFKSLKLYCLCILALKKKLMFFSFNYNTVSSLPMMPLDVNAVFMSCRCSAMIHRSGFVDNLREQTLQ